MKDQMRKIYFTITALFIIGTSMAQNFDKVIKATNVEFLRSFAEKATIEAEAERKKAIEFCEEHGYPTEIRGPEGQYSVVVGFDETGKLEYFATDNLEGASTISTDKIQVFGLENFNLSGRGFTAGIWDGGQVLTTHQEFTSRVALGQTTSISDHATHVAGTMIAQGINPLAKGMANQATLISYDFQNPEGEMANEAANGMLVSNHSWGSRAGWSFGNFSGNNAWHWWGEPSISQTEDFAFGRYSSGAQAWDQIAINAPYFTMVKSAGNHRNESGPSPGGGHYVWNNGWQFSTVTRDPDGPYDCINNRGMAKNIISVGAVGALPGGYTNAGAVNMSGFSSWGPADDSRVKPDLVANGTGVYSSGSGSNTAYYSSQGTSMSAPTITGSILLLQEHYSNVNTGDLMRSETVRGLLIHTCDEAGTSPGPDFSFGWGLANIHKAAEVISNNGRLSMLSEENISQGQTETYQVYSDGTEPLKASITWLDPAGTPPTPFSVDDPTPSLVNDLDLRIISTSGTELPWKLNAASQTAPATKGDNIVDNVEVVEILNPSAGAYTIQVTHKGSLSGGQQSYALVATGIKTADSLDYCNPIVEFNSIYGQFTDGSGANTYSNDQDCAWLLNTIPFTKLELSFEEFDLDNSDVVNVYNGANSNSPLLGSFSGNNIPQSVKSTSNVMYITFQSDSLDNTNQGFLATYTATNCGSIAGSPVSGFSSTILGDTCNRQVRFISSASNYDSVVWYYGNGDFSTTTDAVHFYTYGNGGLYDVLQVAYGKCNQIDSTINQLSVPCLSTGIEDLENSGFALYPNPNAGIITVNLKTIKNQDYSVSIFDLNGSLKYRETLNSELSRIDIRDLPSGVYFYNVINGSDIHRGKIIKE